MLEPSKGRATWFTGLACAAFAFTLGISSPAIAEIDLLEIPAVQAKKAAKALALNITARGNRVVAVGERGIILVREEGAKAPEGAVTDSQGNWWMQAEVPVSINLTSIAFASDEKLFAVGHDGVILRSTDTGATWEMVFDGNDANEQVLEAAKKVYESFEAKVEAARDAMPEEPTEEQQQAMDDLEVELEEQLFAYEDAQAGARFGPARPMLDVWFKNEDEGLVVGSYGQIFETKDGGDSWVLISDRLDNPDYRHYNGLYGDQTGLMLIAGESGRVYRSTDFGQTWTRFDTGYIGHLYGTAVIPASGGQVTVLAYGFAGNVFRLGPGADGWWKLNSPTDKSIVGAVNVDDGVIMVDQLGRLIRTDTVGTNLQMINAKEGQSVTGMVKVDDQLILSAQGGPRALALP